VLGFEKVANRVGVVRLDTSVFGASGKPRIAALIASIAYIRRSRRQRWTSTNLGKIDSMIDGVIGPFLYGFNIIGIHGRPLVTFSFDTQEEAESAHKAMRGIVASAKRIKPHVVP
jgi:hypothetical protein